MDLFQCDDAMDIDDALIAEVLTPTKSKLWIPMDMDEDSGLGMDFDPVSRWLHCLD